MKEKAALARKQGVRACLWHGKKTKAKKRMTKTVLGWTRVFFSIQKRARQQKIKSAKSWVVIDL